MQFSDTSGLSGLIQECEYMTGLGDAAISGNTSLLKHFTRSINKWYYKVVTMILDSQDGWDFDDSNYTDYPVATTAMVASQRDYVLPTSQKVLRVKRVDVTYDGTTYYKAEPFDINESGSGFGPSANTTMETTVDNRFSRTAPKYDLKANSIWIYPRAATADVTAGAKIRIEFSRELDEFTTADTTQEPGFDEPFHAMLAVGASLDFAIAKGKENKNDLAALMADYEGRIRKYYGKKEDDREIVLKGSDANYQ